MHQTSECTTKSHLYNFLALIAFSLHHNMPREIDESLIILALEAVKKDPSLSLRAAAKIYGVDHTKLVRRRHGMRGRRDIPANSRKLTDLEESVIVQYIINLYTRSFPPWLSSIKDIANQLLYIYNTSDVGQ